MLGVPPFSSYLILLFAIKKKEFEYWICSCSSCGRSVPVGGFVFLP
jgi:hypothetical protein